MKRIALSWLLAFGIAGTGWAQEKPPEAPMPETEVAAEADSPEVTVELVLTEDETAILAAVDSYVAAFNKGDGKALAQHWTEDGEFVMESGEVLKGHDAMISQFSSYFESNPGVKLELTNTQIKMISPRVASESGLARVLAEGQEPSETVYEAIHVKTPEGWRIDSVKEEAAPEAAPSHYDHLQSLDWMIGKWVDNAEEGMTIETTGRWTTNQNFIVRTFRVFIQDQVDFEGTQVIGWDPSNDTIRSWTFDSDGGFGVGRWSNNGSRWTVQALSVLPDGRRASSTNIYDVVDENTVQFKSIGRQVDGQLMPSIETLTIIRAE
ncbi:SgcJ/EcaC family oxidoreductase [Bremerella cremea]|uniref:YybH family protein n=1 Tax=Bremerella cremea TaxID=1031537 RepID=UPI0031E5DEB2